MTRAWQILEQENALSAGSTLWIMPDRHSSEWAKRIDWYLNFLVTQSDLWKPQELEVPVITTIKEEELNIPSMEYNPQSPLIIASGFRLPNQQTVKLPYSNNFKTWLQSAHKIWQDLGKPSLRLFLPKQVTLKSFKETNSIFKDSDETLISAMTVVQDMTAKLALV